MFRIACPYLGPTFQDIQSSRSFHLLLLYIPLFSLISKKDLLLKNVIRYYFTTNGLLIIYIFFCKLTLNTIFSEIAKFSCDVQTQVTLASLPSTPMLRPSIVLLMAQSGNPDEQSVMLVHSVNPVVVHSAWLVEFIHVHLN